MVHNVILAVVGGLVIGGIVGALFGQKDKASPGAMAIAGIAGGLISYAAVTNFSLPLVFSLPVAGGRVFVFWIVFGNFWGALLASLA
ncbi:MAG: DUF3938 domain-containing protein, partial [Armatimonadetes bacterium]|nr:DUF3938 domain-containing protein [Armatimonadota bacterium]